MPLCWKTEIPGTSHRSSKPRQSTLASESIFSSLVDSYTIAHSIDSVMGTTRLAGLLAALAAVGQVAGHGYVSNIIINGVSYANYNPSSDWYQSEANRPIR